MSKQFLAMLAVALCTPPLAAQDVKPFDAAASFGARQSVANLSLSPDGMNVAYVTPSTGQGSIVTSLSLAKGAAPRGALASDGKPDRIGGCNWVSNLRMACIIYGVVATPEAYGLLPFTRLVAVDADGGNLKLLSTRNNYYSQGIALGGGNVIDWLPEEDGVVLMTRVYLADTHIGSRIGVAKSGLGVDRVDTRTLATTNVEPPRHDAVGYLSDGRGAIRIMVLNGNHADQDTGVYTYLYRVPGSREWQTLGKYSSVDRGGFRPVAIDHDRNLAYGFKKKDGRDALYAVTLDDSLHEELIYARPDVDVDDLIRIGRRRRVVGVSFATDVRQAVYFDPDIKRVSESLAKALHGTVRLRIADSSVDENKLLIFAGSDHDAGAYYLFDRQSHQLQTFLVARSPLEGAKLATVKPITYPASDGTLVPGYLTLPPDVDNAKGLPAIVLPHGGPGARDEWGFDWLSQFYAARGYVVLQPNFRGSAGYGDAWLQQNGFRSWPIAIGDVLAAGRWLVAQGIADPAKLGIVGWSYGGYAALQSAVVDPTLFKAVVAIAPVTDLAALKEDSRHWSNFYLVSDFIGDGPHVREGSPALNAGKIKVPVLLFHGTLDRNVNILQSKEMAASLEAAGVAHELVIYDNLDHYLEDSAVRAEMLRKSDAFLRKAMGLTP